MSLEGHYQIRTHIPEYECDVSGRARLSFLLKLIQRGAGEHLVSLGLTYQDLKEENQVFLLAKLGLRILRHPVANERVVLYTCPQGKKGAQLYREVILTDEAGERLMEAHSVWLLVDPVSRHILRPDQFHHTLPQLPPEQWLEPLGAARYTPQGEVRGEFHKVVAYSDMDVNEHLNNTVYADMVCNCLPYERLIGQGISTFHINYQSEARLGTQVDMTLLEGADGCWYVVGRKGADRCFESRITLGAKN